MPTRKIADLPPRECRHPEHYPPKYVSFEEEGIYEHTCPGCGTSSQFPVVKHTLSGVVLTLGRA